MKRCIRCKAVAEDDVGFCPSCGFDVFDKIRKPSKFAAICKCLLYVLAYFALQIGLVVAITFFVALAQAFINGVVPSVEALSSLTVWITDISNVLFVLILLLFFKIRKKSLAREIRLTKFKPWVLPISAVLGFSANIVLSVAFAFIPWPAEWVEAYGESTSSLLSGNVLLSILSLCILTGIVEEILFRGIVVTRLRSAFGPVFTVIFSAALFAVVHLTPTSMPTIFVFALFLAATFMKYDSIVPVMVMHAAFNLAVVIPFPESTLLILGEALVCLSLFIITAYLLLRKQVPKRLKKYKTKENKSI